MFEGKQFIGELRVSGVSFGQHDELIKRGGFYAEIFERQIKR